jgi:hypothetical protein
VGLLEATLGAVLCGYPLLPHIQKTMATARRLALAVCLGGFIFLLVPFLCKLLQDLEVAKVALSRYNALALSAIGLANVALGAALLYNTNDWQNENAGTGIGLLALAALVFGLHFNFPPVGFAYWALQALVGACIYLHKSISVRSLRFMNSLAMIGLALSYFRGVFSGPLVDGPEGLVSAASRPLAGGQEEGIDGFSKVLLSLLLFLVYAVGLAGFLAPRFLLSNFSRNTLVPIQARGAQLHH